MFDVGTVVPEERPYRVLYCTTEWLKELQTWLRVHCTSPWCATTRLDNDDTINLSFIKTIQRQLRPATEFLNMPNGVVQRGLKKTAVHHKANPFMTYVEPGDHPKSIYFTPHGLAMAKHAPIRQLVTPSRLWTQIIHERNYVND